jgi:hypothetical protein
MNLVVTEPRDSTLFIWKSSVWHHLELVFTSYLFLSPPHSRSFTITIICSFFVSPYLSFLVLLLQFTLQLSLACFAEYVLHLTRLNPDMMYIHQDSGLVNVSYFKFDVDDTTGGCVHLLVRLLYIDIFFAFIFIPHVITQLTVRFHNFLCPLHGIYFRDHYTSRFLTYFYYIFNPWKLEILSNNVVNMFLISQKILHFH